MTETVRPLSAEELGVFKQEEQQRSADGTPLLADLSGLPPSVERAWWRSGVLTVAGAKKLIQMSYRPRGVSRKGMVLTQKAITAFEESQIVP